MELELECSTRQALVIRVNGTILKFTLGTFALIIGLNCIGVLGDFKFNTEEPNMLIVQYFGSKDFNRRSNLIDRFNNKVWADNEDDTIKFAIFYFIHTYVYSGKKTTKRIPRIHFNLVESGRYMQYPWCRKAFHWLLKSNNKKMTSHGKFYRICGMHIVLQIWIYECSGKVHMKFRQKDDACIPRLLNWQTIGAKPRYNKLMSDIFNDGNRGIHCICSHFTLIMYSDNVNDEDDGQRPPPITSPDLSRKQHQNGMTL
ncbi:hypothetical protein KY290_003576 [Solanum tuberosum]|uniref:DUF1985 domain-containing protein n=1 Tax=Solanum tuberosum TaxID=4113 RepID=A0ABQ7WT98_SOLTU|nr:hypothetical protein KY284_024819 [Solanum tuberosum]KAH0732728.1 hypothetical protein KY289_003916 [Solanum tuberosum]KAH0767707.1 hypothetical protein KY285_003578 [Solanum tuberosum]KAH0783978.1 hypothetical protein KY290_003576 [Solanum tuberosum]